MYVTVYKKKGRRYYDLQIRVPVLNPSTGKPLIIAGKRIYKINKTISTKTTSEGRAMTMAEETENHLLGDTHQDHFITEITKITRQVAPKAVNIYQIWDIYLENCPKITPAELKSKKNLHTKFLNWLENTHPTLTRCDKITPAITTEYAAIIKQQPTSGKTKNNKISRLKSIFTPVVPRANLRENPWHYVAPADEYDSIPGRELYPAEIPRVLKECKAAGGEWYEMSLLAWTSYLRYKDLCFLEKDQFRGNYIVNKNYKTLKYGTVSVAYVPDNVMAILKPLLAPNDSKYLFPTRARRYKISGNKKGTFGQILKKANVKSNPHGLVSFHSWRHGANTDAANEGVEMAIRLLSGGWTNEDIQEKYNHSARAVKDAGIKAGARIQRYIA